MHALACGVTDGSWLEADLASVNRTATPWVVITGHRMMVCAGADGDVGLTRVQYTTQLLEEGDYIVSLHMREALEPLIYQYQVNLMLVGHQHSYGVWCGVMSFASVTKHRADVHGVPQRVPQRRDGDGAHCCWDGGGGAGVGRLLGHVWQLLGGARGQLGLSACVCDGDHADDAGWRDRWVCWLLTVLQFVLNDEDSVYDEVTLYPWTASDAPPLP